MEPLVLRQKAHYREGWDGHRQLAAATINQAVVDVRKGAEKKPERYISALNLKTDMVPFADMLGLDPKILHEWLEIHLNGERREAESLG